VTTALRIFAASPRWWFDWNLQLLRFGARVAVYLALRDDRYPSTEDEQAVHLDMPWPDVARGDVSRGMPLALFDYVVGIGRWHLRVVGYAVVLATDAYPPFRLAP
jgi:hypothetical protein